MNKNTKKIYGSSLLSFMENSEPVVALRRGLFLCIPFFIIGAFCTMFTSFPIEGYQQWLQTFVDGWLYYLLMLGAKVTLGSVTLYVILAVSYSYAAMTNSNEAGIYMLMSMGVYLFFTQESIEEFSFAVFDSNWLFTGLLVTMCSCALFRKFHGISKKHWGKRHQVVLLFIVTMIYLPFIRISETYYNKLLINNIQNLKEEMMECEEVGETINLHKGSRSKRDIVKMLTRDLRAAIKNGEIMLYYQPQVTSDETVYGMEALLRWKHPAAGFLYPPLVIELARQDGRLDELGLMIIEKAAASLEHLGKIVNRPIHMAVNISPVQFESDTFCSEVEAILKRYDFGECILCFEITEQMALSTTAIVSERIERLKKDGIPFHMDDFGMGHSSMKYLQNNEFEAVKLDGSLVRQMMQNDRSQNIISGIQQMALPLKYELIAEYVETEVQREKLRELGCHIYQGALYSWAVPMDELEVFLEKYHACKKES